MQNSVEIFPWNKNFESGIEVIDTQHKQLVKLLNVLVSHLAFQSEAPEITKVFDELKAYTAYHFSTEEKIWHEHFRNDSWEELHQKGHADFIAKVLEIKGGELHKNPDVVIEEIVSFLTHWLAMHIIESDKRMAKVVLALPSGMSLEECKVIANQEMEGATRVLIETVMGMYDTLAHRTIQMTREISRRIKAEQDLQVTQRELIRLKDEAIAANAAKSTFLANMSHELRTPLNGIMGMINFAQQRMSDPTGYDQLDKAKHAADHLLAVINDILDISKIEANKLSLETTRFNLASVLESTNSMVGYKARAKGLDFVIDAPFELLNQTLLGDPLRLGQILINLTGNAVKFTRKGQVKVIIRELDNSESSSSVAMRFEVKDSGIGVPQEAQTSLFSSFQQADASTTRKYGGTGLGLAICKQLVQLMGGKIGLVSKPDFGSTFWFELELPKGGDELADEEVVFFEDAEKTLIAEFSGVRILVAEDDEINQEVARCLLEDIGLVIDLAKDGQQAIDLAKQNHYALILMDMQMPNVNGINASIAIRNGESRNRATPILAMTANAFAEDRSACLEAGMNDHISKPVVPEHLYSTLLKWLKVKP